MYVLPFSSSPVLADSYRRHSPIRINFDTSTMSAHICSTTDSGRIAPQRTDALGQRMTFEPEPFGP